MTDKIKYTVTMEVEIDAVGPAQAIRQALDWARDTESGEGVVTVRAANLSPLRAAVADGRVAQLFTGPVHTGVDPAGGPDSTAHATIRQGVDPDKVRRLAVKLDNIADQLDTGHPSDRRRWVAQGRRDAYRKAADMVEALTNDH